MLSHDLEAMSRKLAVADASIKCLGTARSALRGPSSRPMCHSTLGR